MMLLAYLGGLAGLALLTAYTRNFQRSVVALGQEIDPAAMTTLTPRAQWLRTLALVVLWPLAFGFGMLFVAWWKAVLLVVGAFALLVPVMGTLTPRAGAPHYLCHIRNDLGRRAAGGGRDAAHLQALLARVNERASAPGAAAPPPPGS